MKINDLEYTIEIPDAVNVEVDDKTITVKGPKGEQKREFNYPKVNINKKGKDVVIASKLATMKEKTMMGTLRAHLRNMIQGVNEGFTYKLAVCSSHFPMNISVNENKVITKNFLGEKIPRTANILEGVSVKVQGKEIVVEGIDLEKVGQTAANIEHSTKITNRDRRRFQDGIYITQKGQ